MMSEQFSLLVPAESSEMFTNMKMDSNLSRLSEPVTNMFMWSFPSHNSPQIEADLSHFKVFKGLVSGWNDI